MGEMKEASIIFINGPIVKAKGMRDARMYEMVEVGSNRLIGEIVRLEQDVATIQVYENTSGMKPLEPVYRTGSPLSLRLGPGLIGNIYDGIQRPLAYISEKSGPYVVRGEKVPPLDENKKWHLVPKARKGDDVTAGQIIAAVQESAAIELRLMVPPEKGGALESIVPEGDYKITDEIYAIKNASGETEKFTMCQKWPARKVRPYKNKLPVSEPLITGQRIIDTLFPLAKGGTATIPGGFGTGKTMTQQSLAKWSDADIIVYIGCGERGNEMTEVLKEFPRLIDPRSGKSLMERTILIANTSNMPVAAREVSIYTGVTFAEYYRDMGYHVAIMADSTSRWAEALRELSSRLGEMPAEEGFPAHLATNLAEFYERAGAVKNLNDTTGSISIVGSVSPPGGDFSEPVTQHTRRFVRCFWALDKELANARHYPSINWLTSYSEYTDEIRPWWEAKEPDWSNLRNEVLGLLQKEGRLQQIVKLVGPDVLPDSQRLVLSVADLIKNAFLQQNAFDEIDMYSDAEKQMSILKIIIEFYHLGQELIASGTPLVRITQLACIQDIVRAKSVIPNGEPETFEKLAARMRQQMAALGGRAA